MNTTILPRLAVIAGPTASGKSGLALRLARRTGGLIVNSDALQVYRDLRVLTARPSALEEAERPHRLFGHVDAAEAYDVARWLGDATAAIGDAAHDGRLAIVVGGTGLYLRALLQGLAPVPAIQPEVRAAVRAAPLEVNRAALAQEDPAMAARLRPTDPQRIARALEVIRSTGRSLADWQTVRSGGIEGHFAIDGMVLEPDRAALARRMAERLDTMLDGGAADEVDALIARSDVPDDAPVWRAIGAREVAAWRRGSLGRDEARSAALAATRAYAKRQRTWFARQVPASWARVDPADVREVDRTLDRLARSGRP